MSSTEMKIAEGIIVFAIIVAVVFVGLSFLSNTSETGTPATASCEISIEIDSNNFTSSNYELYIDGKLRDQFQIGTFGKRTAVYDYGWLGFSSKNITIQVKQSNSFGNEDDQKILTVSNHGKYAIKLTA